MLGQDFEMPAADPNRGPLRVLFIYDEARILRALKALFRDLEVYTTTEPREAPALAQKHNVDVVVCDQRMPEMLGVDVLREIREKHPRAMRVLLTGYSDLKAVLGSVNEGEVYRFVNKPWVNSELRALVLEAGEISRESPAVPTDQLSPNEQNIARLARVLKPGGEFRFASDWANYAEWTLWRLLRTPEFVWTAERADDWRKPWDGFTRTRYEAKAIREGRTPCYLIFRRV